MTEADKVRLYNDLCDYEYELKEIIYPVKTREIDIVRRAIEFMRGSQGKWLSGAVAVLNNGKCVDEIACQCSSCGFAHGHMSFKYCPNCGARMKK